MDKTQFLQKKNILMEKVADADMVLVGIGEEFNEDFKDIWKFPRLMAALEEVDTNPFLEWTVPFLEHRYLVMGVASKALAGKADGKAISAKVKELLA